MNQEERAEISKQVGRTIAKYRKNAGLSQAAVAELLEISNDAVSRMERGTITLNVERLFEFARIFNCRAADFLTDAHLQPADQTHQLARLLSHLSHQKRTQLIHLIEQMIDWKNEN